MDQFDREITSDDVRIVTSSDGLSTLKGKVNVKPVTSSPNAMRQGFESVIKTINNLIEDSHAANQQRRDDIDQLDAKLTEKLSAEITALHQALAKLEETTAAHNARDQGVDQLREQVDNISQQVQRLKDVIVKEMRETLSLRNLIETNTDKVAESQKQTNHTHELISKQQSALDAMQTMQRELQQRSQQAEKQAMERSTTASNHAAQNREMIESLRQEIAQMRTTAERLDTEAANRHAVTTQENDKLKLAVATTNRRFSTLIGLGFVGVLIIVGAIAAAKYL